MTLKKKIQIKIDKIPDGQFITYSTFKMYNESPYALSKTLSRLSKEGLIKRYKKGVYFKPKKTAFGIIGPSEKAMIELLIDDNKGGYGYLSGSTIYNDWGITTQISNEIVIVTNKPKKSMSIGKIKVKYSKGISPTNKKDIRKLQLLDIIKDFKKIPDRNDLIFVNVIKRELQSYDDSNLKTLLRLAMKYNPRTRALLGAILELLSLNNFALGLKKSLNQLTTFDLNISSKILPNKRNWQIS